MSRLIATAALLALSTGHALAQFPDVEGATADDEIVSIDRVPIEDIRRVTRADGNVFYVSGDNRWLITGEVTDMWTGKKEHTLEHHNQMRWGRTGTSIQAIPPEGWVPEGDPPEAALFLPAECDDCEVAHALLAEGRAAPVPYGVIDQWREWGWIWCQTPLGLDIVKQWLQNDPEIGIQRFCGEGEKAGRAVALAEVFNMSPAQPTLIDQHGNILRGSEEIAQWAAKSNN